MRIFKLKKLGELNITADNVSGCVSKCSRNVVLTDLRGENYDIELNNDDALIPLQKGHYVMAELEWEFWEGCVKKIMPLEKNAKIKFEGLKPLHKLGTIPLHKLI